jgi:hypothetical protein
MCGGSCDSPSLFWQYYAILSLSIPVMPERGWPQEKFAAFFIYKLWGKHCIPIGFANFWQLNAFSS